MADNTLLSLTQIFNQKIFRIPDFQRGYSWEKPQLDDFWDDIQNLKTDKIHYTGLLTVEPISKKQVEKIEKWQDDIWLLEKGLSAYYVIDGQQRLTTAIIFINELLKRFMEDEGINYDTKENWTNRFLYQKFGKNYKSFIFGYEKDNPSDEFFTYSEETKEWIQKLNRLGMSAFPPLFMAAMTIEKDGSKLLKLFE
jgi:uncharacterized protein with ParB-like and HNH nuclease domain